MKKNVYIAPAVETHRVELEAMIALSLIGGGGEAEKDGTVLVKDDNSWNIWGGE